MDGTMLAYLLVSTICGASAKPLPFHGYSDQTAHGQPMVSFFRTPYQSVVKNHLQPLLPHNVLRTNNQNQDGRSINLFTLYTIKNTVEQLVEDVSDLTSAAAATDAIVTQVQSIIQPLQTSVVELQTQFGALQEENEQLQEQILDMVMSNMQQQTEIDALETTITQLTGSIDDLNSSTMEIQIDLENLQTSNGLLEQEIDELEEANVSLQAQNDAQDDRIEEIEAALEEPADDART